MLDFISHELSVLAKIYIVKEYTCMVNFIWYLRIKETQSEWNILPRDLYKNMISFIDTCILVKQALHLDFNEIAWITNSHQSHTCKSCMKYKFENTAKTDIWIYLRWNQVSRRIKQPLPNNYTCHEP
jgi:hypothetical protein